MALGRAGTGAPFALGTVLVLLCSLGAHGAKKDYFLKRYKGDVDSICLSSSTKKVPDITTADALIIGSKKGVQASGRVCTAAVPYTRTSSDKFGIMSDLPAVFNVTSFNVSVWDVKPNDTVTLTAENSVPKRPLSVVGTPSSVDLSAPGLNDPNPSLVTLPPLPASSFNSSYEKELRIVEKFLSWFDSVYSNPKGLQAAIVIEPDSENTDGSSWVCVYFVFVQNKDGTTIGQLFTAMFSLSANAAAGGSRRRLLSLRGRSLLQYGGYDGGYDVSKTGGCYYTCKFVPPNSKVCGCR